jgi:hypothetical protein
LKYFQHKPLLVDIANTQNNSNEVDWLLSSRLQLSATRLVTHASSLAPKLEVEIISARTPVAQ